MEAGHRLGGWRMLLLLPRGQRRAGGMRHARGRSLCQPAPDGLNHGAPNKPHPPAHPVTTRFYHGDGYQFTPFSFEVIDKEPL